MPVGMGHPSASETSNGYGEEGCIRARKPRANQRTGACRPSLLCSSRSISFPSFARDPSCTSLQARPSMKASDLFVKALEAEKVEYVFGIPGEENLDLLESLRRSKIKLVLTRHEQAAGFMAATYGRLTGKTGVCLATLGAGATNLVTAAAYAQLGAMPMLMITGQKPIRTSQQGQFQLVDVLPMLRTLTKMATQIVSAQSIPTLVRDAFRVA